jgi:hypothetical protein
MLSLPATVATIVRLLHTAIGGFVARQARPRPIVWLGTRAFAELRPPQPLPALPNPAWALFQQRLARLATRFQALFDRWQSNTLPTPRAPRARPASRAPQDAPRLPRAQGWVGRRIPEAAPPASFLISLLQNPETQSFVHAAPQAGRLLRPLCRALGIPAPDWLKLPRRPRPARPRPDRPRPPRAPRLTDPDLGLQPYVIAAARASKKRYG